MVFVTGTGTFDFTALTGWTNITSFSFSMPIQTVMCDQGVSVDCSGMAFDNVTFQPFVRSELNGIPEPGTLALFALGLAGLGFARRKRRA